MDLNLLRVFAAIYEQHSLSRAAEQLYLTQPAISHSLKRLREHYGDPLFIRDGRAMRPSALALQMGPKLLATLKELELLQQSQLSFDPSTTEKRFVIGAREALESLLMVKLVQRLSAQAPLVEIASVAFNREQLSRDLERRHLDLVVDVPLAVKPHIGQQALVTDEFCVLASKQHPYAQQPTLERYLAAKHVAVSGRPSGPTVVDYALQRHGLARNTALRCQHYHAACAIAAESDYLVTLPRGIAEQMQQGRKTCLLPLPVKTEVIQLQLYWHKHYEDEPSNRWLRQQALSLGSNNFEQ